MNNIEHWINNPQDMGAEAVKRLPEMIEAAPYCATYRLLYLVALANVHSAKLESELKRQAIALPDRVRLFQLINQGEYEWVTLMQQLEERHRETTEVNDFELIDHFLESWQNTDATEVSYSLDDLSLAPEQGLIDASEEDEAESLIPGEEDEQDMLIDNFLQAEEKGTLFVPQPKVSEVTDDDPNLIEKIKDRAFLTESLAKVYVKQHKYEQALAIFSELNLKYSKKNSYFADQIRFLEKVIAYTKTENDKEK